MDIDLGLFDDMLPSMTIIVSHISAIEFWLSRRKGSPKLTRVPLPAKGPTVQERAEFTLRFSKAMSAPVHALVGGPWPGNDNFRYHTCSAFEPSGLFASLGNNVFVCPIDLAFTQVATDLSLIELVQLGFEVCGCYSIDQTADGGFFRRAPLATPEQLLQFANSNPSIRGAGRARQALRYVAANAASPAETRIAMSLTLPLMRGGLGLPKASLNHNLPLTAYARRATGRHYFVCDLFWPEQSVAVEYDSDLVHTGSQRIANDSARRNALSHIGVTVVTITRLEYRNRDAFNRVARIVATHLGKRIRIRDIRFDERQILLRKSLAKQPIWKDRKHAHPL